MYETRENFETELNDKNNESKLNIPTSIYGTNSVIDDSSYKPTKPWRHCEMCRCDTEDSLFIILSCNHSFHINCIANQHQLDAKNCHVLDDEFFNDRKCYVCETQMDSSEIMYIHSKFSKATVNMINTHDLQINKLERQINKLKEEMKIALEYKQRLEFEKEKSKQIMLMLNLTLN